jgi:AraC-like DNA-binding protein
MKGGKNAITQYKFKDGLPLEFEVLSIKDLFAKNRAVLTLPHRADFYHIIWIEKGTATHLVDFNPIHLSKGTVLFINKGKVQFFDASEKYDGKVILFTDRFFNKSAADLAFLNGTILFNDFLEPSVLKIDKTKAPIEDTLRLMISEASEKAGQLKGDIVRSFLNSFLLMSEREKRLQGFKEIPKGADRDYTILFLTLVNENFAAIRSVQQYADMIHISEKRLNRATNIILGKYPKEIINDRVLLEAKRLLVHTNLAIKEIGFDLGFVEATNFIKCFKQQIKQTPSEFRESHLS